MSEEIEKVAQALAERAVERKYMRKAAQGFEMPQAARSALVGALIGGTGTGLISALSGRRRKEMARDLLMGALVGGAGGAALPYISQTVKDLSSRFSGPKLTSAQRSAARQKSIAEAVQGTGGPGIQAGATGVRDIGAGLLRGLYGEGSGADALSYIAPAAAGGTATGLHRWGELKSKGLPKELLPASFGKRFPRLSRGLRAGSIVTPSAKGLKYGVLTALLSAAMERIVRMPTPQGAAQ